MWHVIFSQAPPLTIHIWCCLRWRFILVPRPSALPLELELLRHCLTADRSCASCESPRLPFTPVFGEFVNFSLSYYGVPFVSKLKMAGNLETCGLLLNLRRHLHTVSRITALASGHLLNHCGHLLNLRGHLPLLLQHWGLGHLLNHCGHLLNRRGHLLNHCGHLLNRQGHLLNHCGHLLNHCGHLLNRQGHVDIY